MEIRGKILIEKTDFFSGYNLNEIRDWYLDLANEISKLAGIQATAPKLLRYYLNPKAQDHDETVIDFCKNEIEGRKKEEVPNYFGIYTNEQAGTYEEISEAYLQKIKDYTEYKNTMKNMLNIFLSKQNRTKGIIKHIKDKGLQNEYELNYYDSLGFSLFDKSRLLLLATNLKSDSNPSQPDRDRLDVYVGLNTLNFSSMILLF